MLTRNLTMVDFLNVTIDLNSSTTYSCNKPNEETVYIHKNLNRPQAVIRIVVSGISE